MTTTADAIVTPPGVRPAPRWARNAAHGIAFLVLPSSLWRSGVALGWNLGYTEAGRQALVGPTAWGPVSMIGISVLAEIAALLACGLVHRWGVVVPQWIPGLGGRTVPRRLAVVPAWTGAALLAVAWTPFLLWWAMPDDGMTATGQLLVGFVYLPLVAWAPALAAVTLNYQRRRLAADALR
ncbi:MAG: hypothetical protein ACRD0P_07410 [Stackebrandtia sp.]